MNQAIGYFQNIGIYNPLLDSDNKNWYRNLGDQHFMILHNCLQIIFRHFYFVHHLKRYFYRLLRLSRTQLRTTILIWLFHWVILITSAAFHYLWIIYYAKISFPTWWTGYSVNSQWKTRCILWIYDAQDRALNGYYESMLNPRIVIYTLSIWLFDHNIQYR